MSKRILCIGRMQAVMDSVLAELRGAGYEAEGAVTVDDVIQLARGSSFDALLVGGGVQGPDRVTVVERVQELLPEITVVYVERGPGRALEDIRAAIGEAKLSDHEASRSPV